jgi:hypothetical protein
VTSRTSAPFTSSGNDVDAGVFLDVLFQALQGVGQRRAGQAEVVADLVHLADDLVRVLLAVADESRISRPAMVISAVSMP